MCCSCPESLQILRLSRPPPLPPTPPKIESKIDQKIVSKKKRKKCAKVVSMDSLSDPHGRPISEKNVRKVNPKCLSEKMITQVVHSRPLGMPSDLQNDAPARAGASFFIFPLSRKCAPKVIPLAPFWEVFGHQNHIKSLIEALQEFLKKSTRF